MNGDGQGTKRVRTTPLAVVVQAEPLGRRQLLISSPELQTRLGKKYCNEAELLPLLLTHGFVQHVRTIDVEVRPLGGDSFKVTLNATRALVGEAKLEIERAQGTPEERQDLYKVAVRLDGGAVREDDAEPEALEDAETQLRDGDVVALSVKEMPLVWRTCPEDRVSLSEGGAVATHADDDAKTGELSLVTSGVLLTRGRYYWEVELLLDGVEDMLVRLVGVSKPNLNPKGFYGASDSTDGWFVSTHSGCLYGNGKQEDDGAGGFHSLQGDRVGVLLDLDDGSLHFFKNGVQHGPGYPAGSVKGPVVHALQMGNPGDTVRLLSSAPCPWGLDKGECPVQRS
jgi:hypothetical protein